MKCPKCGKEIAEDSAFCEFCGATIKDDETKSTSSNSRLWMILGIILFVIVAVLVGTYFIPSSENCINNDLVEMNLQGHVSLITEITYYTDSKTGIENKAEYGGFFDNASFLACVYGDEHIARCFYRKWFLSQVSDCEIQFNSDGNIISMRSTHLDENGIAQGCVRYKYNDEKKVLEMDTRVKATNQDEGVITYAYAQEYNKDGRLVQMEYLTQQEEDWKNRYTIEYNTNSANQLIEAIFTSNRLDCHFNYMDNKLKSICFKNYWGEGRDASFKIAYNKNGDIQSISSTGKKGRSESARETTFEYQYDSQGNWVERKGIVKFISGEIYNIRTVRMYQYN